MKKLTIAMGVLLVATTLLLSGCFKTKEATVNKYISVKDGTLVAKEMPSASSDVNIDVTRKSMWVSKRNTDTTNGFRPAPTMSL